MYLCRSVLSVPLFGQMKESYRNCRCYKRCSMKFLGQENVSERERERERDERRKTLRIIMWMTTMSNF